MAGFDIKSVIQFAMRSARNPPFVQQLRFGRGGAYGRLTASRLAESQAAFDQTSQ